MLITSAICLAIASQAAPSLRASPLAVDREDALKAGHTDIVDLSGTFEFLGQGTTVLTTINFKLKNIVLIPNHLNWFTDFHLTTSAGKEVYGHLVRAAIRPLKSGGVTNTGTIEMFEPADCAEFDRMINKPWPGKRAFSCTFPLTAWPRSHPDFVSVDGKFEMKFGDPTARVVKLTVWPSAVHKPAWKATTIKNTTASPANQVGFTFRDEVTFRVSDPSQPNVPPAEETISAGEWFVVNPVDKFCYGNLLGGMKQGDTRQITDGTTRTNYEFIRIKRG